MKKIAVVLILVFLVVPLAGAVVPADTIHRGPVMTDMDLNRSGITITNHSFSSQYGIPPSLIEVRVGVSDTSLPGPKGEMAAGPRTIGFSTEPLILAVLGIAIPAGAAGVWYLVRRKPNENEEEDEGSGK